MRESLKKVTAPEQQKKKNITIYIGTFKIYISQPGLKRNEQHWGIHITSFYFICFV